MIQFMLDNLGCKTCEGRGHLLPILIAVAYHNVLIASGWPAANQGQAGLLCLVGFGLADKNWIIHDQVTKAQADNDDPLLNPNHISRQTNTGILMGQQSVLQILPDGQVCWAGLLRFLLEKEDIFHNGFNHNHSFLDFFFTDFDSQKGQQNRQKTSTSNDKYWGSLATC